MEYGSKLDSLAKAHRACCYGALLLALNLVGSTTVAGPFQFPQTPFRTIEPSSGQASVTSLPVQLNPKQTVVQFGAAARGPTPGSVPLDATIRLAEPTDPAIQQPAVQENSEGAGQPREFDGNAAFGFLTEICKIGPRPSASRGMEKQQKFIQRHFEQLGAKYFTQEFSVRSPYTQEQVKLYNLLIQWHPERTKRILICCHHDTRPFADADKANPRAKFIGANDGGSGVALLCELGKHIAEMDGEYGVDFMFFDGEEFVIVRQRDPMFLGSTFFAQKYAEGKIPWKYESAILVDMVADKDLQIHLEGNSMKFAKGLTEDVWAIAKKLGINEFVPQQKQFIRDDHLPLNEIAKIPTCDIIDFDFPNPTKGNVYWHTREDKLENCSAESLAKVGSVVLEWIRQKQKPGQEN